MNEIFGFIDIVNKLIDDFNNLDISTDLTEDEFKVRYNRLISEIIRFVEDLKEKKIYVGVDTMDFARNSNLDDYKKTESFQQWIRVLQMIKSKLLELLLAKRYDELIELYKIKYDQFRDDNEVIFNSFRLSIEKEFNELKQQFVDLPQKKSELDEAIKKFEIAIKRVDVFYDELEVLNEAKNYNQRAKECKTTSNWFLGSAILISILILVLLFLESRKMILIEKNNNDIILNLYNNIINNIELKYCFQSGFYENIIENLFTFNTIKYFAIKISIISFLIALFRFSIKQYKINMHNFMIYSTWAQTLSQAFKISNEISEDKRGEFWSKIVDNILNHKTTGYEKSESKDGGSGNIIQTFLDKTPLKN